MCSSHRSAVLCCLSLRACLLWTFVQVEPTARGCLCLASFTRPDVSQGPRAGLSVLHPLVARSCLLSRCTKIGLLFHQLMIFRVASNLGLLRSCCHELSVDVRSLLGVHLGVRSLVNHVRTCRTMIFLQFPATGTSLPLEPPRWHL